MIIENSTGNAYLSIGSNGIIVILRDANDDQINMDAGIMTFYIGGIGVLTLTSTGLSTGSTYIIGPATGAAGS